MSFTKALQFILGKFSQNFPFVSPRSFERACWKAFPESCIEVCLGSILEISNSQPTLRYNNLYKVGSREGNAYIRIEKTIIARMIE